jgi:DNA-binding GntR family transcriptional regulator
MQYPVVDALVASHVRLLAAVGAADLDGARQCWRDHMRYSIDEFLAVLPAVSEDDTPPLLAEMFRIRPEEEK